MAKESTALAVADRTMPEPTAELAALLYDAILNGTDLPAVGDPELVNRQILQEIIAAAEAGNFDKVFQAQSLPNWNEWVGDQTVIVYGFHTNPSRFEGGSSAYAVVEIGYPDGAGEEQRKSVVTGGQKVLVQLVSLWQHKMLPAKVKLTEKATGHEGRKVLGLELVQG